MSSDTAIACDDADFIHFIAGLHEEEPAERLAAARNRSADGLLPTLTVCPGSTALPRCRLACPCVISQAQVEVLVSPQRDGGGDGHVSTTRTVVLAYALPIGAKPRREYK